MRILHVLDHSIPVHSGYAFRTLAILHHQRALGWETAHLTSAKHPLRGPATEEVKGFTFHRSPASAGRLERLPLVNHLIVVESLTRRLGELVPRIRPDVIHAHSPSLIGVAAIRARRRFGVPVVYEVRALWEDGAVDHGLARAGSWRYRLSRSLESWVLRQADAVTTICHGLHKEIAARGIAEEKMTVIPNGVDAATFRVDSPRKPELARALGLDGAPVIGFIGSFYGYEGLGLLLGALPAMLAKMPSIRVLLVGSGYEEQRLKRQCADLGLGKKVVFTGEVPHESIGDYYNLVDVFVYPRERTRVTELVTPLKPLEAMAQGRAVVASDVGGHRELIRDGDTGLLFRAGDPRALVEAVLTMLANPELAAAMRLRARRFVEVERTWSASVRRYSLVYGALLNRTQYGVAH